MDPGRQHRAARAGLHGRGNRRQEAIAGRGDEQQPRVRAELPDAQGERGRVPGGDSPGRAAAAPGRMTTGLTDPSSPKNGIGTGRWAQMAARASPPRADPVNPAAAIAGCGSSRTPGVEPADHREGPGRGPPGQRVGDDLGGQLRRARMTVVGLDHDRAGPAARAEAVSPPATEKANGKLLAAKTATGQWAGSLRRRSGTAAPSGPITASPYPPSPRTAAKSPELAGGPGDLAGQPGLPSAVSVSGGRASSSTRLQRRRDRFQGRRRPAAPAYSHGGPPPRPPPRSRPPRRRGLRERIPGGLAGPGSYPWIIVVILA